METFLYSPAFIRPTVCQAPFWALAILQHTMQNEPGVSAGVQWVLFAASRDSIARKNMSVEQYILLGTFYESTGSLSQNSSSRHGFEFISAITL